MALRTGQRFRLAGVALVVFFIIPDGVSASKSRYDFTQDWVSGHTATWSKHLEHLKGKPGIKGLEIGSYEGRSAIWFLENILTHPTASMTCIDIFRSKDLEDRFDRNIAASGASKKVVKLKGYSQDVLRTLETDHYDFIYIDGSHRAKDVLVDAVLSWDLLKLNGIIIFDDYLLWLGEKQPAFRPQDAIDAFLNVFDPYIEVIHKGYQVLVKKTLVKLPLLRPKESTGK